MELVDECRRLKNGVIVANSSGKILRSNPAFKKIFSTQKRRPKTLDELLGKAHALDLLNALPPKGKSYRLTGLAEGMFEGIVECRLLEAAEGETENYLIFLDEEDDKQPSGEVPGEGGNRRTDRVTGLPDLTALQEVLEKEYLKKENLPERFGALFLIAFDDVYRFDDQGIRSKGDRVLAQLAKKLSEIAGEDDFLSYIGNDRFVYVQRSIGTISDADALARKLLHLYAEPVSVDGELFYLNLSIGISLFPTDAREASGLLQLADRAMREARKFGWNRHIFSRHLRTEIPNLRPEILEGLRKALPEAIETEQLHFVYQPQYSLKEHRFVGAELLARWRHPEWGVIAPDLFLSLAEQTGMIRFLTVRALTQAAKTFSRLKAIGREDFSLSINLSPSIIFQRDFLENLEFFLDHYGLRGCPLHFEITENLLAHHMGVMRQSLEKFQEMGIRVEVDDYGTGYTSLSTLIELPVHTLKIDRKYVRDIDRDSKTKILFRAMVQTAEALGLEIIAEGVEREEEREVIESIAPSVVLQGWLYASAMDEKTLLALLSDSSA